MPSSSSRPSKETLSEKLASGPYHGDHNKRKSTRKRNSLTSETNHTTSTAASSTVASSSAPSVNAPISPQHTPKRSSLDSSSVSTSTPPPDGKSRTRRRRVSVDASEEKKKEEDHNPPKAAKTGISVFANLVNDSWEERIKDSQEASSSRLQEEERQSKRGTRTRRSSTSNRAEAAMASSSHRSSSTSRRRSKSASKLMGDDSKLLASPSSSGRRRRISTRDSSSGKTKKKSSSKSKKGQSSDKQSLTSFMQNENSSRPPETEEMLEVRSAYTSISRSRNRNKTPVASSLNLSYHGGESAVRNTRTYREMTRSRSSSRTRSRQNNIEDALNSSGSFREEDDAFCFQDSVSLGGTVQSEGGEGRSFRRSLSDDPQQRPGGSLHQLHNHHQNSQHQFRQSFSSLPVLPEESKRSRKSKISSSKSSSRKSKKSAGSISTQELSEFLNQCNSRRKKEPEDTSKGNSDLSSPMSGDRSCVSMPANFAKEKKSRKSSSKNGSVSMIKAPPLSKAQTSKQVSPSDHALAISGRLVEKQTEKTDRARSRSTRRSSSSRQHRGSTGNTSKTTREDKPKSTTDELSESMKEAARQRSKSVNKGPAKRKEKGENSRTRSLSRSRNSDMDMSRSEQGREKSNNSNKQSDARKQRPKNFQKLFSIRDLTQGDPDNDTDSQSQERTSLSSVPSQPESLLKTPVTTQRATLGRSSIDDADLTLTPPPPLTPYSPCNSAHSRGGFDGPSKKKLHDLARIHRASIPSRKNQHLYDSTDEDTNERQDPPSPKQPVSILKNKTESGIQPSGDNTEESGTVQQLALRLDAEEILDFEAELGFTEDVFSHYSWYSNDMASIDALEATKPERDRLKAAIRESHLYSAFENLVEDWC